MLSLCEWQLVRQAEASCPITPNASSATVQNFGHVLAADPSRPAALLLGHIGSTMLPRRALLAGRLDTQNMTSLLTGGTSPQAAR
jgi:hypothetical protein